MASHNSHNKNELNPTRVGFKNWGRNKYRGVQRLPSGRWNAKIEKKGIKRFCIGTYDSDVEAARAYDRMAEILHGAKAVLNFPPLRSDDNSLLKENFDETSVADEIRLPVEISDSTLLDANTDAKPLNLINMPANDFGISDEFFKSLWS